MLTGDGDWQVVVGDPREGALAAFADELAAGTATPGGPAGHGRAEVRFPTSVCFGGQGLRTAYVGWLAMPRLATFWSPVPGLPMNHWR